MCNSTKQYLSGAYQISGENQKIRRQDIINYVNDWRFYEVDLLGI